MTSLDLFLRKGTTQKSTPKKRRKSELKKDTHEERNTAEEGDATAVVNGDAETRGMKYWLMKAEPETRIVKGKVRPVNCRY
jgi:hypothetical protein